MTARVWGIPKEPYGVYKVSDRDGDIWRRAADGSWWHQSGNEKRRDWSELFWLYQPLKEVLP